MLSPAIEDYLKTIYQLTYEGRRASTNMIANRMGVSAASATGMLQRLATCDTPLVDYRKHYGVLLTSAGERAALEVIRRHRLIETFLFQMLGYTWDEVHEEADRLEHAVSADLEERIFQAIGYPLRDPHGEPIPNRELSLPPQSDLRLSNLPLGKTALIQRIGNTDPQLLRHLARRGMVPDARLTVLEYSALEDIVRVQISGQEEVQVFGLRLAEEIYVSLVEGD
jgi:DtxR family Mn-dependent transcriptional regulator